MISALSHLLILVELISFLETTPKDIRTLEYYFRFGDKVEHVIFDQYTIDTGGNITNKKTGKRTASILSGKYYRTCLQNNNTRCSILIARAIASTFIGPPPSWKYTADHVDRNSTNDVLDNIRWASVEEQNINRTTPDFNKDAFIIVKNNVEKTAKEWAKIENKTEECIRDRARNKRLGFSYKEYPDLPGEVWKYVSTSKDNRGVWWISNQCRIKYITKHAENVIYEDRLGLIMGYPRITINKVSYLVHDIVFKTFYPDEYKNKTDDMVICHINDIRTDFRPENLELGSTSDNMTQAYGNGKYEGTKTDRQKCMSTDAFGNQETHESQHAAARYLRALGYSNEAYQANVRQALLAFDEDITLIVCDRTWSRV
jgi:hypothetical protein